MYVCVRESEEMKSEWHKVIKIKTTVEIKGEQ